MTPNLSMQKGWEPWLHILQRSAKKVNVCRQSIGIAATFVDIAVTGCRMYRIANLCCQAARAVAEIGSATLTIEVDAARFKALPISRVLNPDQLPMFTVEQERTALRHDADCSIDSKSPDPFRDLCLLAPAAALPTLQSATSPGPVAYNRIDVRNRAAAPDRPMQERCNCPPLARTKLIEPICVVPQCQGSVPSLTCQSHSGARCTPLMTACTSFRAEAKLQIRNNAAELVIDITGM